MCPAASSTGVVQNREYFLGSILYYLPNHAEDVFALEPTTRRAEQTAAKAAFEAHMTKRDRLWVKPAKFDANPVQKPQWGPFKPKEVEREKYRQVLHIINWLMHICTEKKWASTFKAEAFPDTAPAKISFPTWMVQDEQEESRRQLPGSSGQLMSVRQRKRSILRPDYDCDEVKMRKRAQSPCRDTLATEGTWTAFFGRSCDARPTRFHERQVPPRLHPRAAEI